MTNDGTGAFDRITARTQEAARQKVRSRLEWEGAAYEESHLNLPSRLHMSPTEVDFERAFSEYSTALESYEKIQVEIAVKEMNAVFMRRYGLNLIPDGFSHSKPQESMPIRPLLQTPKP